MKQGLAEYFGTLFSDEPTTDLPEDRVPQPLKPHYHTKRWDGLMAEINEDELLAAVRHMRTCTAPGPDLLQSPLLKWAATPVTRKKGRICTAPTLALTTAAMRVLATLWQRCLDER